MDIECTWRGHFGSAEVNALHAAAFGHATVADDWQGLVGRHSLGWGTARRDGALVGFINVVWDGLSHAWIQDLMVAAYCRRQGIGTRLVAAAREGATRAGCEWLHVDFDEEHRAFYIEACGFTPAAAGLIALR